MVIEHHSDKFLFYNKNEGGLVSNTHGCFQNYTTMYFGGFDQTLFPLYFLQFTKLINPRYLQDTGCAQVEDKKNTTVFL